MDKGWYSPAAGAHKEWTKGEGKTGMPVNIAENPLDCVIMGTGKALENYIY